MDEKQIAVIGFIALIVVSGIAVYGAYAVKTTPGYDAGLLKDFFSWFDKFVLGIDVVLGLFLFVVSLKAYGKVKTAKFLFVLMAFALFALMLLAEVGDKYIIPGEFVYYEPVRHFFELGILLLLFVAIFRR